MRRSGVLMHISSLPSPYGIGTMGEKAYRFADFLADSGQHYWQILPLNPTGFGDSPYQSFSVFAGNPYFIDLDILCKQGLLTVEEILQVDFGSDQSMVDFEKIYYGRFPLLKKAFNRFDINDDSYKKFSKDNSFWLDCYALYMAAKEHFNNVCWLEWEQDLSKRESKAVNAFKEKNKHNIDFYKFVQFCFYEQWAKLKKYANSKGVEIIGDMPIYVALDSSDVWANPDLFKLDPETGEPTHVAGCPPDYYCEDGQLWGNPLYNWTEMKKQGYHWWIKRIQQAAALFDIVRIDHFRGFDAYYSIPYGHSTARYGQWEEGPKYELFQAIENTLGKVDIIAENLGHLSPSVFELLESCGFVGMTVLQFGFDPNEDNMYLPHNCVKKSVIYTGTHDNNTVLGWADETPEEQVQYAMEYLCAKDKSSLPWAFIHGAWASVAETAITQMQDLLELGGEARMNTPSTLGINWQWRMLPGMITEDLIKRLYKITKIYHR